MLTADHWQHLKCIQLYTQN